MRQESRFVVAAMTVLVLTAFVLLMRFVPHPPEGLCESSRCTLQDWLGATSGWAGFVAAVIAAAFVFEQLSEQRKQTAFLIGDTNPTMTLAQPARAGTAVSFELVNWNRRRVTLHEVHICPERSSLPCPQPILLKFRNIDGNDLQWKDVQVDNSGTLVPGRGLMGWIDRQGHPPGWWIELHFEPNAFDEFTADYRTVYIVDFCFALDDDEGKPRWLHLRVPVVTAYLSTDSE